MAFDQACSLCMYRPLHLLCGIQQDFNAWNDCFVVLCSTHIPVHTLCYVYLMLCMPVNLFIANILRPGLYAVHAAFIYCLSCWLLVRVLDATKAVASRLAGNEILSPKKKQEENTQTNKITTTTTRKACTISVRN